MPATLLRDRPLAAEMHPEDFFDEFMGEMCDSCYDEFDAHERAKAEDVLASFRGWVQGRYYLWLTNGKVEDALGFRWRRRFGGIGDEDEHFLCFKTPTRKTQD